jgi:hypothetical protein
MSLLFALYPCTVLLSGNASVTANVGDQVKDLMKLLEVNFSRGGNYKE